MVSNELERYLTKKYDRYSELSLCHVQTELLCNQEDAKMIVRKVCNVTRIKKLHPLSKRQFLECVTLGLELSVI